MKSFEGKIAVVTGGGTGIGRELCLQLVKSGCAVATCDVLMDNLKETQELCNEVAPDVKVTLHRCDVSSEAAMNTFRDETVAAHGDKINLLFNNAGIGSPVFFNDPKNREDWERVFNISWFGVYYGCRAFMPLLVNCDEAHVINTSSINGFWASLIPPAPHTAYSAAKFAVKGFTEALITDLRLSSPHVKCSVVMPGHVGTSVTINAGKVLGRTGALEMSEDGIRKARKRMLADGASSEELMNLSDDQIREVLHQQGLEQAQAFRDNAPTSAAQAATIILDGVKAGQWRIMVGEDAQLLDQHVRANPEMAYEPEFLEALISAQQNLARS